MNEATHHLVVQGPDVTEALAASLQILSDARTVQQLGPNAFRLRQAHRRPQIIEVCRNWRIDYAFVPVNARLGDFGLIAMDMDSTLITIECIDELADLAGVKAQVSEVTASAMRGEIEFAESLRRRVALLEGLPTKALEEVYEQRAKLSPGAEALMQRAKELGIKTLLVSGGFTYFVDRFKTRLGFDYARSNLLDVQDGKLTGRVLGEVFDAQAKAATLRETCANIGIAPDKALVLGDGANDLPMMSAAGVSVAYHAKPLVKQQATYSLDYAGLDGVLNLFL